MLLTEILADDGRTIKTAAAHLNSILPAGITAQVEGNLIAINASSPFEGLDFLKAFGFSEQKLEKTATKIYGSDPDEDDDGEYEYAWQDACYQAFDTCLKKLWKLIPSKWTVSSSICSFERDGYCPYINIKLKSDFSRKSRSKNTVWYHVTLAQNISSIKKHGLLPKSNIRSQMEGYRNRVFLFSETAFTTKYSDVLEVARNLQSTPPNAFGGDFTPPAVYQDIAIFKVTLPPTATKRLDPHTRKLGGIYVTEPIPPSNLQLVYQGSPMQNIG